MYERIRLDIAPNGVANLTFNLLEMANTMDLQGVQETLDALRRCEQSADVGAMVRPLLRSHGGALGFVGTSGLLLRAGHINAALALGAPKDLERPPGPRGVFAANSERFPNDPNDHIDFECDNRIASSRN